MTQDKARKIAIRQRMAETGEPYSVARHAVEDEYVSSAGPLESPADHEAGHLAGVYEDGPPRWHHAHSRPAQPPQAPQPPRPPRLPRIHHDGPQGQDDWPRQDPDPVERLQDRVDQFIHRLSSARDQAGRLISAAERIFTPAPPEPVHSEPASKPGPADSA